MYLKDKKCGMILPQRSAVNMKKEVEERNYYLGLFNTNEPTIDNCIKKYKIDLQNPITIARRKNQELEAVFSKCGKSYYAGTVIGPMLVDHVLKSTAKSIEDLEPVIDFENHIMCFSCRLPFKNPHLDTYQKSLSKIEEIGINENLSTMIGNSFTQIEFLGVLVVLARELVELSSPDFANQILQKAYKIIESKESSLPPKATQKVVKR